MLDKESANIDAVIVAIPDHMHATAALCRHGARQARLRAEAADAHVWEAAACCRTPPHKYKVATQMGNQGYSNEGTRQCAEMIWSGEIGNVTEVHAWTNRPIWPQGLPDLPPEGPVPDTLDWDLWLGIAEHAAVQRRSTRPLQHWRGFYDFGCGALGDMACHILGAPNVALRLGAPTSVECVMQEGKSKYYFPDEVDHPVRISRRAAPCLRSSSFWYDGMKEQPEIQGVPAGERLGDLPRRRAGENPDQPCANPHVQGQIFTRRIPRRRWQRRPRGARRQRQQAQSSDPNARLDAQVTRLPGRARTAASSSATRA